MAIHMINEAMNQGARQEQACEVIGISNRTLQHWQQTGLTDQRQQAKKVPVNKLSDKERVTELGSGL
jgi:putative transposase